MVIIWTKDVVDSLEVFYYIWTLEHAWNDIRFSGVLIPK